jgi:hypothetical protein
MSLLRKTMFRFRALFQKEKLDAQMDDEMRSHIEMQTPENIEAGMTPEEARSAALRQFGWVESIKAICREQRGVSWIETLGQNIRRGARMPRKSGLHPRGSGQSNCWSFCRTSFMRSSGRIPMPPLITDRFRVVSLSTRITEGLFKPVPRQSPWLGATAMARTECEDAGEEVRNATIKSSGKSHCAKIRQGRRFELVKSVNGNAAWTISPGWNIPGSAPEPRVFPPGKNISVAVNFRLIPEEIECPALLGEGGDSRACQASLLALPWLKNKDGQMSVRRERNIRRNFQHSVLDLYFQCSHEFSLIKNQNLPRNGSRNPG